MDYLDIASMDDVFSSQVAEEQGVHNHEMNVAWRFVTSTNVSVFLTGKAGTGKTFILLQAAYQLASKDRSTSCVLLT